MRTAAREATRWAIIGSKNPAAPKSKLKQTDVELYGQYAMDLGLQNPEDTELNMSPEGMERRKALKENQDAKIHLQQIQDKRTKPPVN